MGGVELSHPSFPLPSVADRVRDPPRRRSCFPTMRFGRLHLLLVARVVNAESSPFSHLVARGVSALHARIKSVHARKLRQRFACPANSAAKASRHDFRMRRHDSTRNGFADCKLQSSRDFENVPGVTHFGVSSSVPYTKEASNLFSASASALSCLRPAAIICVFCFVRIIFFRHVQKKWLIFDLQAATF